MPPAIVARQQLHVGTKTVVEGSSLDGRFTVVFEDDGGTGYFYALDPSVSPQPIQDTLHIYNVKDVSGRDIPSAIEIAWSSDNLKAALLINRIFHAVFDFSAKQGYCRTGFPPRISSWSQDGHAWSDQAIDLIK